MVSLWRAKYNYGDDVQPPKRDTLFRGKPFKENAYYEDDYDIMEQAIREVLGA